jgi:thiol-disulfide isomerase/thioredoxin
MMRNIHLIGLLLLVGLTLSWMEAKAQSVPSRVPEWDAKAFRADVGRQRGKSADTVVIVNFWATWCAPCVEELPEFVRLDSIIKARKLPARILMVSFDFRRDLQSKLIPFVTKRIPDLPCVLMVEPSMSAFINGVDKDWSGSLPATLVTGKRGSCRIFLERQVTSEELLELVQSCIHSQ